jgi:hypothetical protein
MRRRVLLLASLLLLSPALAAAQELPLKRAVPNVAWSGCPPES